MAVGETKRPITLKRLAMECDVSMPTISRYINKSDYVGAETASQIQRGIEKLQYFPNASAKSLAQGKTMSVGLAIYQVDYIDKNQYFSSLISGLIGFLGKNGYSLQVMETCPESSKGQSGPYYLDKVKSRAIDGLVIADSVIKNIDILHLQQYGTPFVIVDRLLEQAAGQCVLADHREMGYRLAKFLLARGHRRLVCFGVDRDFTETEHQLEGFYRALREYNSKIDSSSIVIPPRGTNESGWVKIIAEVLSRTQRPTAAVCPLPCVCEILTRVGLTGVHLPDDFEFAGAFPDTDVIASRHCVYAVATTTRQLGRRSGRLLLDLIGEQCEGDAPVIVESDRFFEPNHDWSQAFLGGKNWHIPGQTGGFYDKGRRKEVKWGESSTVVS